MRTATAPATASAEKRATLTRTVVPDRQVGGRSLNESFRRLPGMETGGGLPWDQPDWLERAAVWTTAELLRLGIEPRGELRLERTRPRAAVAWLETSEGWRPCPLSERSSRP